MSMQKPFEQLNRGFLPDEAVSHASSTGASRKGHVPHNDGTSLTPQQSISAVDTFPSRGFFALSIEDPWMPTSYSESPSSASSLPPTDTRLSSQRARQHPRVTRQTTLELQDRRPEDVKSPHISNNKQPSSHSYAGATDDSEDAHLLQDLSEPDTSSDAEPQMSKRAGKKTNGRSVLQQSSDDSLRDNNGHADTSATMNSVLEHRRGKHGSADKSSPTSQAASLMQRESFSLDNEVPIGDEGPSKGFLELSKKDQRNFLLLVLLYFLQGIPMGLAMGSVPFLLKSVVSYSSIGVFSLAAYPYSLKLLWSPIVDAVWTPKLGRRKSWILPIQAISGVSMLWLGTVVQKMMEAAGEKGSNSIWDFTFWWFALVFLCATQDIAVDGWALTLLSQENLAYASTAQTVGLTAGHFLSHTVFLAFNSKDFINWLYDLFGISHAPAQTGWMNLDSYLTFWGWSYLAVTLGLALLKREERTREREGIMDVYRTMWGILKLKNVQTFIVVHLIAKIGFQANDAVTSLKLLDKGFSQEHISLVILIDFPIEVSLGYYIGKWCQTYPPMRIWCWAFMGRLFAAAFAQFVVSVFPAGGTTTGYLLLVICEHVLSTFMNTVMFVAVSAFHAKISDPAIGGTYMTLLATVSNLGGTFPRYFVLRFVDYFTVATCIPPTDPPKADLLKSDLITQAFSCALEADKHRCLDGGGKCNVTTDGYYVTNIICIIIGVVTFWGFIKPAVTRIQALPMHAWRLAA